MANEVDYNPCQYKGNGVTRDFSFNWKVIEVEELIVSLELVSTGDETILTRGSDYTAQVNAVGGNVTLTTAPSEDYFINIKRQTSNYQSKGYSTSSGFQGSEIEKSFDKVSCCLQDMQHGIDTFKEEYTAETDQKIEDFEGEINSKLTQVNKAVEQLNRLDEVLVACEGYAVSSEEQSIIAQNQAVLAEEFAQSAEQTLAQIQNEHTVATADIEVTKQQAIAQVQATGIYMQGDRLFYVDSKGVKHEFRNDYGGIAPMAVKHKEVKKVDNGFALTWTDPDDSVYQNNVYCTWKETTIVRKLGTYPESVYDGEVVLTCNERNKYSINAYIDNVDSTKDYKYRAFPCSINNVYSLEEGNKFGQWIYSLTRIMKESVPSEKIVYRGTNAVYKPAYMDFSSDTFNYGDWKNAPFLLKDRLAPCVVGFNGELKYFLNPDNYLQKEDGTASDVKDTAQEINCFMRIKLLYRRKRTNAEGNTEIDISNEKVNDEYKPYGSFIKPDNTLREYIYLPIYRGSLVSNRMRSMSGNITTISSKTGTDERTYCQNVGAGHDMITHADRELIEDLTMLMFKTTDLQSALGKGKSNGGSDVGACLKSGTMDTRGLFYGSTSDAVGIKLFGMENRYASQWERVLGEVLVNGVRKVKLGQGTLDGSTVTDFNFTGEGYITLSELPTISGTSGGYISVEQTVNDIGTFPVVISGSSSTYECDGMWFNNSGTMVAVRGGNSPDGALCGLFCSSLHDPVSTATWVFGSSVSYKPL